MTFLRPTLVIDGDVTDINLEALQADGVRGIVLDLDSTIVAPRSGVLTPAAREWLTRAREHFKLAVVSNNKKTEYLTAVQKVLEMPVVGHARKPNVKVLLEVLSQLGVSPTESVLIGDRPLTDIFAGQRAGMKTILVYPLKTMNEPGWIGFVRRLERLFIQA